MSQGYVEHSPSLLCCLPWQGEGACAWGAPWLEKRQRQRSAERQICLLWETKKQAERQTHTEGLERFCHKADSIPFSGKMTLLFPQVSGKQVDQRQRVNNVWPFMSTRPFGLHGLRLSCSFISAAICGQVGISWSIRSLAETTLQVFYIHLTCKTESPNLTGVSEIQRSLKMAEALQVFRVLFVFNRESKIGFFSIAAYFGKWPV